MAYAGMKNGGGTVEMASETAFGTAGDYYEQRLTPTNPTLPTDSNVGLDVPFTGHRHWGTREAQRVYEKYREGAITIPTWVGYNATESQLMTHLEAAGCNIHTEVTNTILAYSDTGSWSMTNDETLAAGVGITVPLDTTGVSTTYPNIPVLCNSYTVATNAFVPTMDIPTPEGNLSSRSVLQTLTATPRVETLAATDTRAFRAINYYTHTANESSWIYTGCAVQSIADVVFEPSTPVEFSFTYHVAKITGPSDATIATESFQDSDQFVGIGMDTECHCNLATFADPITTNTRVTLLRATWTPGIGTVPIPGYGSTSCINGIQGYQSIYTGSKIVLEILMDKSYWTDWSGTNAAKYVAITQPSSSDTRPAFGLFMPRCRIYGSPTVDLWSEDVLRATVTLEPTCPAYAADESVTSLGMAPWYVVQSS